MTKSESEEFNKALTSLLRAYKVTWKFQLVPQSWFTKLIRKFIKVQIILGVQDKNEKV